MRKLVGAAAAAMAVAAVLLPGAAVADDRVCEAWVESERNMGHAICRGGGGNYHYVILKCQKGADSFYKAGSHVPPGFRSSAQCDKSQGWIAVEAKAQVA
ncbi:hypothetical protein [Lentzea flava]|uniref:Alpha amylase inhibitor n=1 Tax=Lentzea flava TaxID=103732 RepID=A0ABQ2UZM3_9PSEU|nr:hypothetical protein [Lentzea flava]MCP2202621.1 hypothetical protein [Lentzea flava]GGU59920.1 hypothetical protein GCM10010178_60110 [Lentzea flava]